MLVDDMQAYLETRLPDYLALLERWVVVNSFTANRAGVNRLGEMTAAVFADVGFTAEYVPSRNPLFGNHVVLTRPGRSGRKIGLVAHLDTVFPPEDEIENDFHWRIEGDRLYGPGTVDIKGGTLGIYMLLDALQRFAPDALAAVTWVILLDASEETESLDFGELCLERLRDNGLACLVFEGGYLVGREFWLVGQRKGMAVYRVTVEGKASHAGTSHGEGANALVQMAEVVQRIAGFTDYARNLTFNVGVLSGGTVVNRVPHLATALVEMRAFDQDVFEDGVAQMLALNNLSTVTSPLNGYACRVKVGIERQMPPWPHNAGTEALLARWQAAGQQLGYSVTREARGGLSDGNYLWGVLPTLDGLGPNGANAHCSERSADRAKDQEYATLSSFIPKTLLNLTAVMGLIEEEVRG